MNQGLNDLKFELLDRKRHNRASFDCGIPSLNDYLQRQAAQDMEKHSAAVYVAVFAAPSIAGYYTLSQFSIDMVQLPEDLAKKLPRYPVLPATLLGRLAVATAHQGHGLGEMLLFDALRRSLELSLQIASIAVVVDALDERAAAFYGRYGFLPIPDEDRRLFLPMKTIGQMLGQPRPHAI